MASRSTMEHADTIYNDPRKAFDDPRREAIFRRTYRRWKKALAHAKSTPVDNLLHVRDLDSLLVRIPALPARIPSNWAVIEGFSTWENQSKSSSKSCDLRQKQDPTQELSLRQPWYIKCSLSTEASFQVWKTSKYNGLALLVLAWAYILNMSLAERQGLHLHLKYLRSNPRRDSSSCASSDPLRRIELAYATDQEVAWWKLISTPGRPQLGKKERGPHLPWTLLLEDVCSLEIIGSGVASELAELPTAAIAATYLARFCAACGLGDQNSAAFAAALALPSRSFRSTYTLLPTITLPAVSLPPSVNLSGSYDTYPPHFESLSYFMTLSLSIHTFGACLESVVWEPGIDCNVAGAVTRAISKILDPIYESRDYELLAKVLSSTKAAPLWLGVSLCNWGYPLRACLEYGDTYTIKWEEIAPWTGISQSFLDLENQGPYLREDDTVTRANVWRLRHDCFNNYTDESYHKIPNNPWPPFGFMRSKDVDMELQSHLRCSHHWKYQHWTWLVPGSIRDKGYTTHQRNPEPPMPLPLENISIGDETVVDEEDMEAICRISKYTAKNVFFWSRDQVEENFTHNIVDEFYHGEEPLEDEQSDKKPMDFGPIYKWVDRVVALDEDSEDELSRE
ncbi:uncharacterized protein F4817DRAFT_369646 [Daldinia loculata]|uniref:uncharacterized protein n=1 Tax=Daldinia loculata TaxID=103429 RepID=UPI0020C2A40F|nr:uncharacterized protein F4817DRAFT_369646 [Daldinia loculata]KAI1642167.1 hypothetical protein F4817DRAFT_369646 [Daldinia loculata]